MFYLFTVYLLSAPEHKVPEDKDSYSFLYFRGMNSAWHIVSTQTVVDALTGVVARTTTLLSSDHEP